jgi:RimJ/RimL family protein N-acetyltransferase
MQVSKDSKWLLRFQERQVCMSNPRLPEQLAANGLTLRVPSLADVALLNEAIADSFQALNVWMDWAAQPVSVEATHQFVERVVERWRADEEWSLLMLDDEGRIVGATGYPRLDWTVPKFEIGYWVRTSHTGRGLATAATRALADYAFDTLAAQRVELRMDDANVASWRVAERLGFAHEATLRLDCRDNAGRLRDTRIYARFDGRGL